MTVDEMKKALEAEGYLVVPQDRVAVCGASATIPHREYNSGDPALAKQAANAVMAGVREHLFFKVTEDAASGVYHIDAGVTILTPEPEGDDDSQLTLDLEPAAAPKRTRKRG